MVAGLYSRQQPSVCDDCKGIASTLIRHNDYWYCHFCIRKYQKFEAKLIHKRRPIRNNYGRNQGWDKLVRLLHYCWAAGRSGLLTTAIVAYALARALVAALAIGLFWLGLLMLVVFNWIFE